MGDISEMRAVIVILAFVVFTVTLVGLMVSESPSMFMGMVTGSTGTTASGSPTSPTDIAVWNSTHTEVINDTMGSNYPFDLGGWHFRLSYWLPGSSVKYFSMETYDFFLFFAYNIEDMQWYGAQNTLKSGYYEVTYSIWKTAIPLSVMDMDYANGGLNALRYTVQNSKTKLTLNFWFNTTAYTNCTNALASGGNIYMLVGQDFVDRNTSINALGFISGIFTFSLPGLPFIPNLILWLMIFPAAIYLAFIFVLRIIGAVFGGGGA